MDRSPRRGDNGDCHEVGAGGVAGLGVEDMVAAMSALTTWSATSLPTRARCTLANASSVTYGTRRGGGIGLGLAIVKTLAESSGGHVSLADNSPSGLTVIVELPVAAAGAVAAATG